MDSAGPLCVGIDPHPGTLAEWNLPDSAAGIRTFSFAVIDAVWGHAAAVKPQTAFFERHGSAGMLVLEDLVSACKERGLLCIIDAKRGDIGSTMAGYADAFLTEGGPFAGDALTLSPFLGVDSLAHTVETALANARGVFLLALTSNPEGAQVQRARTPRGTTVAAEVAAAATQWNRDAGEGLGGVGLVVGATVGSAGGEDGFDLAGVNGPILAPGLGAQGGTVAGLASTFATALPQVLVNSSRDISRHGPDPGALTGAASQLAGELRSLHSQGQ